MFNVGDKVVVFEVMGDREVKYDGQGTVVEIQDKSLIRVHFDGSPSKNHYPVLNACPNDWANGTTFAVLFA